MLHLSEGDLQMTGFIASLLKRVNVELALDASEVYSAFGPRAVNWQMLTNAMLEPLAQLRYREENQEAATAVLTAFLRKLQDYLKGLHAVTILAGDHVS